MENRVIICSNVPTTLLNKSEAKKYFKSFGVVRKLVVKPRSKKCVVEYATTEDAENAMMQGGEYEGIDFFIEFQLNPPAKKRMDGDPDWTTDPNVQAELAAMASTAKKTYNLRPEKMCVDLVPLSDKKMDRKSMKRDRKANVAGSSKASEAELLSTLRQCAVTVEDKYRVLEARDKLIRLRRNKNVDVRTTSATVGTCPDMCSEKERLMREVQHQVALFEQEPIGRTMNHAIAVKQYSRSSADQEMPLPHELRNVSVLQMTMNYLLHRIMDMCDAEEVNVGEWFHFLWDRMRGIRKDITQQELCCQGSVELVEQCARFHIHCSARLAAEDPSVFDQKINTENLTKCLQTLKYMYHDLAIKGERCPNEAEFRAYIILLNLNDGNFMWEMQQLERTIQHSDEIKFALKVYACLDANNFVRFFKLVKSTTYLNACILLRYFFQVRTRALKTIVQCYTSRLSHAIFPVHELTELLAFEELASTIEFVEYYGLSFNDDRNAVVFSKRHFTLPTVPYAVERAVNVIESKRTCSVGEVVCGRVLRAPMFQTHVPQNSFNEDGFINFDGWLDFEERDEVDKANEEIAVADNKSNDARPETPEERFDFKMGGFQFDLPNFENERQKLEEKLIQERLDRERVECLLQLEMQKQLEEEEEIENRRREERERQQRQLEQEQRRREEERRRSLEAEERRRLLEMREERRQQVIRDMELQRQIEVETTARKHKQEQEKQRELIAIKTSVTQLLSDLISQVEDNHRMERLQTVKTSIVCRYVIRKWRQSALQNKRKRKAFDQDPLWSSQTSIDDLLGDYHCANQDMSLNMMKRYKLGASIACQPQEEHLFTLDLPKLTMHLRARNNMSKTFRNEIFWKLGVNFESNCAIVARTVETLFEFTSTKSTFLKQIRHDQNAMTVCVERSVFDTAVDDYNGLIIIVEQLTEKLLDDLLSFVNHLGDLQTMPVVFVLQNSNKALETEIELLCRNKLISECKIVIVEFRQQPLVESIEFAIEFLARHFQPSPPLLLNTLRGYLSDNAGGELWQRIRSLAKWNLTYKQCVSTPNVAITLYNQAIDKLANIAFNEQCLEHANFPSIFKDFLLNHIPDYLPCDYRYFPNFWRQSGYIKKVKNCLETLKLPEYTGKWPIGPESHEELQHNVHMYCRQVLQSDIDKVFYRIVGKVMQTMHISWIDVVEILSAEMFVRLDTTLPPMYKPKTIFNQLFVIYQQPDLVEYTNDNWFYLKNAVVQAEIDKNFEIVNSCREIVSWSDAEPSMDDFDINTAINQLKTTDCSVEEEERKAQARLQCKSVLDDFNVLLNDLEKSMAIQKTISEKFQKQLKQVLE